jgi:hypothetical protein
MSHLTREDAPLASFAATGNVEAGERVRPSRTEVCPMPDYRDPLAASLERIAQLEEERAKQASLARVRATPETEALSFENELLQLDIEWRSKQERFAAKDERRRARIRVANALLFLFMAVCGILLLFRGDMLPGMLFFAASAVGWIIAGLQHSRYAHARRVYDDDRKRVEHTLARVRRAMNLVRVEQEERRRIAEDELLEEEAAEEADRAARGDVR